MYFKVILTIIIIYLYIITKINIFQNPLCYSLNISCPNYKINGFVSKGYENILKEFNKLYEEGHDDASQFSVYHNGTQIINLWGNINKYEKKIKKNSLTKIFSNGKVIEAVVIAMLVDRKLLDYNKPISYYWKGIFFFNNFIRFW
jgi:hypothetical protein